MITYCELVIDQLIRGNSEIFSSPKWDELLGSSYDMTIELEVEETTGTPASITMKWHHSNSGKGFVVLSTPVSADTGVAGTLPFRTMGNQTGPSGKLGRVGVTLNGGSSPTARVRVWVTGRTHG